jgi:hypothetical protein
MSLAARVAAGEAPPTSSRGRTDVWTKQPSGRERGGAALEYVLVSTVAAVLAVAALGFLGKVMREELARLADRLGVDETPDFEDPFDG